MEKAGHISMTTGLIEKPALKPKKKRIPALLIIGGVVLVAARLLLVAGCLRTCLPVSPCPVGRVTVVPLAGLSICLYLSISCAIYLLPGTKIMIDLHQVYAELP